MQPATGTHDQSGKFRVDNKYTPFHLGVNCKSTDGFGVMFLSPYEVVEPGSATFTPVNKVKVWFEQKIETGTMILDVTSESIEVDFTGSTKPQAVAYKGDKGGQGEWVLM